MRMIVTILLCYWKVKSVQEFCSFSAFGRRNPLSCNGCTILLLMKGVNARASPSLKGTTNLAKETKAAEKAANFTLSSLVVKLSHSLV